MKHPMAIPAVTGPLSLQAIARRAGRNASGRGVGVVVEGEALAIPEEEDVDQPPNSGFLIPCGDIQRADS